MGLVDRECCRPCAGARHALLSIEPLDVSQVEAARRANIPFQRLNAVIKGRRTVRADTALLPEALTLWNARIWRTLQARWSLARWRLIA
jgi:plasmid maintenance system antidote protein VapI